MPTLLASRPPHALFLPEWHCTYLRLLFTEERKLQPPTLVESKDEKREKEYLEKKEKLAEKIKQIEKSTDEQKTELERIRYL